MGKYRGGVEQLINTVCIPVDYRLFAVASFRVDSEVWERGEHAVYI